jgi:hypothetical protein
MFGNVCQFFNYSRIIVTVESSSKSRSRQKFLKIPADFHLLICFINHRKIKHAQKRRDSLHLMSSYSNLLSQLLSQMPLSVTKNIQQRRNL